MSGVQGGSESRTVGYVIYGTAGGGLAEWNGSQLIFDSGSPTVFPSVEKACDVVARYGRDYVNAGMTEIHVTIKRVIEHTVSETKQEYQAL